MGSLWLATGLCQFGLCQFGLPAYRSTFNKGTVAIRSFSDTLRRSVKGLKNFRMASTRLFSKRREHFRSAGWKIGLGKFRQFDPNAHHRVLGDRFEAQVPFPTVDQRRDQILFGRELIEITFGVFLELDLGFKVVGKAFLDPIVRFGAMLGGDFLEFLPALCKAFLILGGLQLQVARDFLAKIDATLKDAGKRVVVLGADRVEFMVVAAGALDRQAHQSPEGRVDPIVDDIVLDRQEAASES